MQTLYFGYFGHAWLHTLKMIYQLVEDADVYLHAKNTLHHSLLFLRYYILKNPAI